ncbi:MAG: tetrahydrodipicolinate N-succinyltransferase N-terminal domain-containing protein [Proteobacteria bacterium]|nr:tetrahydrodipicolinate N-succinyltransferase N-terminal domain-containing protein [Pseudomonadota bacterium]
MSSNTIHSFGLGLATTNSQGEIIEVFYPDPRINPSPELAAQLTEICQLSATENLVIELDRDKLKSLADALSNIGETALAAALTELGNSQVSVIVCVLYTDTAPASIAEAFLKLHLLSHRLAQPHSLNLDGIFGVLRNLAWTSQGAIDLNDLPARQLQARVSGEVLDVISVDKFPKMTSYVVPKGVRIADTARVRLGAYIGEGTTVMHEGFVNFNAGTLGTAMIEGRISAGVVVGENSDLGGGCSTMGTLSGGGTEIISVGKNCLIGANAGIGFPLADGCVIEAGLYVTAGTKLNLLDSAGKIVRSVKAKDISQMQNMLFRRNSLSGTVECIPLKSSISLNEELHSHN